LLPEFGGNKNGVLWRASENGLVRSVDILPFKHNMDENHAENRITTEERGRARTPSISTAFKRWYQNMLKTLLPLIAT